MYFFTADEHYGHANIIKYCNRPFDSVSEMDAVIIARHNEVVGENDVVIHVGDFTLAGEDQALDYRDQLNGIHYFVPGGHDYWITNGHEIWEKRVGDQYVVACHYAMRVWPKSHYNSWQVYGHSHGKLEPCGKQWDVGVDNNDFYPVSFDQLKSIMYGQHDNFNLVK